MKTTIVALILACAALLPSGNVFKEFPDTWTRVPPDVIDVLVESGLPNADSRHWERCAIHWGSRTSRIICPNGYTARY